MNAVMQITGAQHPHTKSPAGEEVYLAHSSHTSGIASVSQGNREGA
jgi:hypothetical protein